MAAAIALGAKGIVSHAVMTASSYTDAFVSQQRNTNLVAAILLDPSAGKGPHELDISTEDAVGGGACGWRLGHRIIPQIRCRCVTTLDQLRPQLESVQSWQRHRPCCLTAVQARESRS